MRFTIHRQLLWSLYERASHLHVHGIHGQELTGYHLEDVGTDTAGNLRASSGGSSRGADVPVRGPSHHSSR